MSALRPLLVDQRDTGGAGNATRRLHEGLRSIDVDSRLLVREKETDVEGVLDPESRFGKVFSWLRPYADELPLRFAGGPDEFSLNWLPDRLTSRINGLNPDLVHLNWVAGGCIRIESLADIESPLVWRLPDMWAMTGGCHYSDDCEGYQDHCGNCPKLSGDRSWDLSRLTLARKRRALAEVPVTVVATSSWLAECARESALFGESRVEVIPNALDTGTFRPTDPAVGRELFDLPAEKSLVLFGAIGPFANPRKGADLLREAIEMLAGEVDSSETALAVFGASEPDDPVDFGLPAHYTGYLDDPQSLALLYSAADVMVVPSRYEGFGQTVTEAMACGTPVVAFDATGPADTVIDRKTGYLATPYDPDDLAAGIKWVLADDARRSRLGESGRKHAVETYHYSTVAQEYLDVYRSLV